MEPTRREIPPASEKQIAYLRQLEAKLGYKVCAHNNMPLWKAAQRITKLKELVDKKQNQTSLL